MGSTDRSILAEMALQFVPKHELVATAGLGHLLRRSATARQTLERLVSGCGVSLPEGLQYRNEQYDEAAAGRPDIVGTRGPATHLIVEGKFWAGLTDNQPREYLKRLVPGGCLLFVAPEKRAELLWSELLKRCREADLEPHSERAAGKLRTCQVDAHWLAAVSWTALLGDIHDALDAGDERPFRNDVDQLASLCRQEDEEAFLPLTALDLARPTPLRVLQFMELVDKVNQRGLDPSAGLFQPSNLKSSGTLGRYSRYISTGRVLLTLICDLSRWYEQGLIPLWLEVAVEPGDALRQLEAETPGRIREDSAYRRAVVGLPLALHVEESEVVTDLMAQIAEILELVEDCPPTYTLSTAEGALAPDAPPAPVDELPDVARDEPSA